jgi:DNA ligase (NAD+)
VLTLAGKNLYPVFLLPRKRYNKDMNKKQAKERIEKLKKEISRHSYLYHVLDSPEISDAAFDSLKHELYKLEQQFPEFITPDSPTQRVGGKPLDKFEKAYHKIPMLSIEDVFSEDELQAWQERIQKLVLNEKLDYFAEMKIDGFGISLIYKNGIFSQGSTRGDGRIGEDVTQNLRTIPSIPLRLREPYRDKSVEIRGEVYMDKKAFEKVNKQREKQKLPLYANPRNTAAGSIRQLDPKLAASRDLKFLAYDLVTDLGHETHQQEHQITQALGFRTDQGKYCKDLEAIIDFYKEISLKRDKLPLQIDGIVVTVNNNKIFKRLGSIGKTHRGMIAFKFPAKQTTTLIKDIKVQVGRTGALTPVAHLKPVQLGGTTISRATLHNEDEIKRLGVKIGDTVIIQRAGDVIPDVVKVLLRLRTGKEKEFKMPKNCPACGSSVIRPKGEAVHRCSSLKCGVIQKKGLHHFVSKKAFDINGLGPRTINQLMDEGLVSNPADIFQLKQGDLLPLERFAEKSAENLLKGIEKSKAISLHKFIFSLGIRHVGEESAINLANHYNNLENLEKAEIDDLLKVKDTGEVMAKSIYTWFRGRKSLELLQKLGQAGVKIQNPKSKIQIKSKIQNKIIVLTGELDSMSRDEAKQRIRESGGDPASSVSKNTDFVVAGKEPGSKYNKAKKIGIKIINEKEFLDLIK